MKDSCGPGYSFRIRVPADLRYEVLYQPGLLGSYGRICRELMTERPGRLVVLSDDRVHRLYGGALRDSLHGAGLEPCFLKIPAGERSKELATFERLLDDLARVGMDRRGLLVNFGGGVVSDVGGFVASAFMRGIAYANFSTSLIGQLDAAVGGKVAVNSARAKNLIGSFHHPVHVAGDPCLLETLSKRDLRSGIAEAIKVGIIASPELFTMLEDRRSAVLAVDPHELTKVIGLAAEVKMELVSLDPYEEDLRRPLNFGHTLGHPIETEFAYKNVRHGEAVAVGMAVATILARNRNTLDSATAERIFDLLGAYDLIGCTPPIHADAVIQHLRYIKLIRGNHLYFVLPKRIGAVHITDALGNGELLRAFAEYEEICQDRADGEPVNSREQRGLETR